jgi:hypothetical protein
MPGRLSTAPIPAPMLPAPRIVTVFSMIASA